MKGFITKVKVDITDLWLALPDSARRVIHTAWQVAGGVLLQGLLSAHSTADVRAAVIVAGAAGLATLKSLLLAYITRFKAEAKA